MYVNVKSFYKINSKITLLCSILLLHYFSRLRLAHPSNKWAWQAANNISNQSMYPVPVCLVI